MGWMEGSKGEEQTSLWPQNNPTDADLANILEAENEDWYITTTTSHHQQQPPPDLSFSPSFTEAAADISNQQLFLPSVDSSASCTSPASASVFNNNNNQVNYFLQPNNPLDQAGGFDLGFESNGGLFGCGFNELGLNNNALFGTSNIGFGSLQGVGNSLMVFNNRCSKILKPLDHNFGAQPTLFQKRAALRKNNNNNNNNNNSNNNVEVISGSEERERKSKNGDDVEDLISIDVSNLNYDSDEGFLESSGVVNKVKEDGGGAAKGKKKKGLPAKNLMAERRRRKKLNDRLYMLRSVVPKISKMDRASILGDAIDYLKELLQKINDLHNELESIPGSSTTSSFYPLTPTTPGAAARIKEELCPTAFATPLSSPTAQSPRVEVRLREGKAVNIHMFCGRKPGILLSTLRAIDNLGLDVQQAVISCFNAFALDIFRAERRGEGQEINPDHIKALLLDSAGFHGML